MLLGGLSSFAIPSERKWSLLGNYNHQDPPLSNSKSNNKREPLTNHWEHHAQMSTQQSILLMFQEALASLSSAGLQTHLELLQNMEERNKKHIDKKLISEMLVCLDLFRRIVFHLYLIWTRMHVLHSHNFVWLHVCRFCPEIKSSHVHEHAGITEFHMCLECFVIHPRLP